MTTILALSLLLAVGTVACAPVRPRTAEAKEALQAQPRQLIEQAMAPRAPGPPPFREKLAPVAAGLEGEARLYSLNFDNAPLGAVIRSVVRDAGLSLAIESEVDLGRPVTVHATNATLEEILDLVVVKGAGYAWKTQAGRLEINRFEERIYVLDYLDVPGVTEVNVGGDMLASSVESSGVSGKFQVQSRRAETRSDIWTQIRGVLEGMKSADGVLQINPQSGLIYIADTPRKLDAMVRLLDSLSAALKRQVLIEAKIIEVRLDDSYRFGIDWAQVQMALNPGNFSGNFFDQLNLNFNRSGSIILSETTSFGTVVDLLATQGDVTVLSNPHIVVLNGQSAVMTVGSQFPFTDITGVSRDEDTDVVTIDATIKRAVFGLQLGITPQISADGVITLNVVPTVTRQEGTEQVQIPVGVAQVQSFDNPVIGLQELATTVRVREGEALVLGGLISQEKTVNTSGLPVLRHIPLLGHLFSNDEQRTTSRELVILLRPHVKETI
jgi:MSHA biogenesis protein MshL